MHMADVLVSPLVGGTMIGAASLTLGHSIKKVENQFNYKKLPLMAMMGSFVFAAQMVNFTIPMTGSSGHLAGGLLLSILLGPYAGMVTLSAILLIQALLFADGGILAIGCNIFNLAIIASMIVYPGFYKPLIKKFKSKLLVTILASILAMELGALAVVIETTLSGNIQLPFTEFAALMLLIHLAIGLVEGIVTYLVAEFVEKSNPRLINNEVSKKGSLLLIGLIVIMSLFVVNLASELPDGLEWSLESGGFVDDSQPIDFALMPDYSSNQEMISDATLSAFVGAGVIVLIVMVLFYITKKRKKNEVTE